MKRTRILVWLALALCWSLANRAQPLAAQSSVPKVSGPVAEALQILSSDEHAIMLEWKSDEFEIETVERGGERCRRIVLRGAVQSNVPGAPQVPVRGALLGVPAAALQPGHAGDAWHADSATSAALAWSSC